MTQRWQMRAAGLDDLPAVLGVIWAEDLRYRGRATADVDDVRERIAADPSFDPDRDMVLVQRGEEVIGAGVLNPQAAMLAVDPDLEGVEVRRALIDWSARRQAALGREIRIAEPAANTPATALYRAAGYRLDRFYAEMVRDWRLSGPPEPPQVPEGYGLRPIDPVADRVALHALDDRAFAERPDYAPETLQEYDKRHLSYSGFAPEWSVLIETEDGELAGSAVGARRPGLSGGYVAVLAVEPGHQRRGIGRALLLGAFAGIHAAGLPRAELHVASDNERALDLYVGVGMVQGERFEHYLRPA